MSNYEEIESLYAEPVTVDLSDYEDILVVIDMYLKDKTEWMNEWSNYYC